MNRRDLELARLGGLAGDFEIGPPVGVFENSDGIGIASRT